MSLVTGGEIRTADGQIGRARLDNPSAVYELGDCSTGCGALVALRARPSRSLFLYCTSCGCAFPGVGDFAYERPEFFAPEGIEFPSVGDVEEAYPSERIDSQQFRQSDFWYLIAETHLAAGHPALALQIAENVIATWHRAPDRAFEIRERACRAISSADRSGESA